MAFALLSRTAGFDILETQAFSAVFFAGASQVVAVTLVAGGAGILSVILTVFVLNLRHVLYGLSLGKGLSKRTRPPRAALAFLLTDEMYGVGVKEQLEGRSARYTDAFLLGVGLSAYMSFNLATLAGVLLGSALPETGGLGLDFVFPLMFLALLVPLLRPRGEGEGVARRRVAVALVSGVLALLLGQFIPAGATIFLAILFATALGTWLDHAFPDPGEDAKDA
jgi:4-azaleucine resistance transporter AzlC